MAEDTQNKKKRRKLSEMESSAIPHVEDFPEPDPSLPTEPGNYFVYGLAIGVLVGAALFFLFGQNRILLCAATFAGGLIGALIKKKD